MDNNFLYEVETRVFFDSHNEAYDLIPFLKDSLKNEIEWETRMYGLDLFKSGELLRVSDVYSNKIKKVFLGYKDRDIGKLCNIRVEQDEEITEGIQDSVILNNICKKSIILYPNNVNQILESMGYLQFMAFTGVSLTGKYEELGLSLKLMECPTLEYPLLLEIEKIERTYEDALNAEIELCSFINKNGLQKRVIRKEPPTLLYEKIFKIQ